MPFACPSCSGQAMEITSSLELPPGEMDDELALQTLKCEPCGFQGIAIYRESRRGRMDSESWRHDGYPISKEGLEQLRKDFMCCPSPRDRACPCAAHRKLSQQNWIVPSLSGVDPQARFSMQLVRSSRVETAD
jgi:hypothetical protein